MCVFVFACPPRGNVTLSRYLIEGRSSNILSSTLCEGAVSILAMHSTSSGSLGASVKTFHEFLWKYTVNHVSFDFFVLSLEITVVLSSSSP